ncbi:MAG: hypothetical protein GF355_09540 [Candidatus Eisenbacteria bacterium]|nr:hypothetical protein [Candidatus Eisenbacteria bacterium]
MERLPMLWQTAANVPGAASLNLTPNAAQMGLAQQAAASGLQAQRINLDESLMRAQQRAATMGARLGLTRSSVTARQIGAAQEEYMRQMAAAGARQQADISRFAMQLPFMTAQSRQQLALGQLGGMTSVAPMYGELYQTLQRERLAQPTTRAFGRQTSTTSQTYRPSFWEIAGSLLSSVPPVSVNTGGDGSDGG